MEHISEDLRHFGVVSDRKLLPWHIQVERKKDVLLFFQAIAESSEFTRFEPRDFAAGGDHVYCTISFDVTFKKNGKKITHDNGVHRFTFKKRQGRRVVRNRGHCEDERCVQRLIARVSV